MDDVILVIQGQEFKASRAKLSEYSDYFRAMFSGNYVENEQQRVNIDVIYPTTVSIILQYMQIGLIDLSEHSITIIGELAIAANFLQVTELIKQIRYYLDVNLSASNWMQTMKIAESAAFMELERLAAVHGLLSFKRMKPEYITTIRMLFWYLSHPYLAAETEFEVFKFGHEWILLNKSGGDALLLILCCLDYKKLTVNDARKMADLLEENYTNSLAEKVIGCIKEHASEDQQFCVTYFMKHKSDICEKYTERVYKEVVNFIKSTIQRKLVYTLAVPMWVMKDKKPEPVHHSLYTYTVEERFEKWLEVADKNLWGWSVVSWGLTKVVVVCGEHGRGTGAFMKDVKVYDVLRQEWTQHGVTLPSRRHAGVTVLEDTLYMLGGVGGYRVVLDSATAYNLNERTFRKIASLPEAIQNPAVCIHNNEIYISGQQNIYKYENNKDCWTQVVNIGIRAGILVSYKGYLYCTQNYYTHLYRIKSDSAETLELVTEFTTLPAAICHLGDRLIVFVRTLCSTDDITAVEEYTENYGRRSVTTLWIQSSSKTKLHDVAGSCVLVKTMPPTHVDVSQWHKHYLERFPDE